MSEWLWYWCQNIASGRSFERFDYSYRVGGKVNLETDLLAKYVQRLVEAKEWR